jgi:hypothetical protein
MALAEMSERERATDGRMYDDMFAVSWKLWLMRCGVRNSQIGMMRLQSWKGMADCSLCVDTHALLSELVAANR